MKGSEIREGSTYEGRSGQHKKVTRIEKRGEGKDPFVHSVTAKVGSGKGNHPLLGSESRTPLNTFAVWAVKEV